jgi:hypothetical protein
MIKKTFPKALSTSMQTVYEVPRNKRAEIVLVFVGNTAGSNGTFDLQIYNKASDSTLGVFHAYTVTASEYFEIGGQPNQFIQIGSGDRVEMMASKAMTGMISVIEYSDIIKGG